MNIQNGILNIGIFKSCSPDFVDQLNTQSHVRDVPKGNLLFSNEDTADSFYIVLSGWVKLYRETLDGSQAIIDIVTQWHMFGETAIFQHNTYTYSAETAEPSRILVLPLPLLKHEIESNPTMAFALMSSMARSRRQQDQEIENRTLKNAPQRIGCFLLRLVPPNAKGEVVIHLPYDKTLVASRLGMQPETFSRALSKLKDAVPMQLKGATIIVHHLESLIDYSCSACSSGFPCQDLKP